MDKVHSLSEAMRFGASLRPQCRGNFYRGGESCAIGAVAEAIGAGLPSPHGGGFLNWEQLYGRFPVLRDSRVCPVEDCSMRSGISGVITHLNDDHRWSREAIAAWLEGQGL